MAKATDAGDCGCGSGERHVQLLAGEVLGDRWMGIVEEIVQAEGAERARAWLTAQDGPVDGDVVVRTDLKIYVTFARDGDALADKGLVGCVCTNDGEVCVCRGACDFDACCDPDGGGGPIVAAKR
jgi:hypothetical protein